MSKDRLVTFWTNVVAASPALAAETVIATMAGVMTDGPSQRVLLDGWAAFTVGTSGTAAQLRVRRTSLTGTLVADSGAITGGIAAAGVVTLDVADVDSPGEIDAMSYVLTLQITAGAAVSTVTKVFLRGIVTN